MAHPERFELPTPRFVADWGWNLIQPLLGTLPEDFTEARRMHIPIDREAMVARLPWGTEVPLRPFFGVMGVAPPVAWGRISSVQPRAHGGHLDNKELIAGTTLFLPVWNEGALFSAGDGHGVQGDGEVCLTALETCMSGTFQVIVRRSLGHLRSFAPLTTRRPRAPIFHGASRNKVTTHMS